MAIPYVLYHGLINKLIYDSDESWAQSEVHVKKLSEELYMHPNLIEWDLEINNSNKTEANVARHGNTVEPKIQVDSSSTDPKITLY